MKTLHIMRQFSDPTMGTHGFYKIDDVRYFTVEQDWEDNTPWVSCIPAGHYFVDPDRYNKGGYDALEVQGVPGRSQILFHRGNVMDDVVGCIAVGVGRSYMSRPSTDGVQKWAVSNSREAFTQLMTWANNERFLLVLDWSSHGNLSPLSKT